MSRTKIFFYRTCDIGRMCALFGISLCDGRPVLVVVEISVHNSGYGRSQVFVGADKLRLVYTHRFSTVEMLWGAKRLSCTL